MATTYRYLLADLLTNDHRGGDALSRCSTTTHTSHKAVCRLRIYSGGKRPLNKNYAGIGYTFDGVGFAAPKPYPSWLMDSGTYLWGAPTPMPTDGGFYSWNEETLAWVESDLPA